MNNKWCSLHPRILKRLVQGVIAISLTAVLGTPCARCGGIPEWLNAAAQKQVPSGLPKETVAIVVYSEQQATVKDNGQVETLHREAVRILRPEGRDEGEIDVPFSPDRAVLSLKGWAIPPTGKPYEVGEKDAVEFSRYSYELYSDNRVKQLKIPASEPGAVIGYEYVLRERPYFLQQDWNFQRPIPVEEAHFSVSLPPGWEFATNWRNYAEQKPQALDVGRYAWLVQNVPALKPEREMPTWAAVASSMSVNFFPGASSKETSVARTWSDLGAWYNTLTQPRRQASPEIQQKVVELTAGATSDWERIQKITAYVQNQIRYVAIEIGIGGYQPHAASDVFRFGYGDCKDKASLLAAMLHDAGIDSSMVLVNTERGEIVPEFPSLDFDHAILAIHLPDSVTASYPGAEIRHPQLGKLLFFDPTNPYVPLGQLPRYLQAGFGLVSEPHGGELIALPVAGPESSRRDRVGRFTLSSDGKLTGTITENSTGSIAANGRDDWTDKNAAERTKQMESFLGEFFTHFSLASLSLENLNDLSKDLAVNYSFFADGYARAAGNFQVVRTCIVGQYAEDLMEQNEPRRYPVEFEQTSIKQDDFQIVLPAGYAPVEVPDPVDLHEDFAEYQSRVTFVAGALLYQRTLTTTKLTVPVNELPTLKRFYREISADEHESVLLQPNGH